MGRKGRIWCALLTAICSCETHQMIDSQEYTEVSIIISGAEMYTRAADPDEDLMTSLTLFIFDENGFLEEKKELNGREIALNEGGCCRVTLLRGKKYSFYACANIGMSINADSIDELKKLRCYLSYPDEYREGIPMAAMEESVCIEGSSTEIRLSLRRLMSKISLRIDRGGLGEGIRMHVTSVKIGNCPRSAAIFEDSRAESGDDCFPAGFTRSEAECSILNGNTVGGVSGALSLYMLENMQGIFSPEGISNDSDKVFDQLDIRSRICSYIEMSIDYTSPMYNSTAKPLLYRFYLGEDRNSLNIERNCHYNITVIPEDDGLSEDSWRVDKSGLTENDSDTFFEMTPSGYIRTSIADKLHVRCSFRPESAPFDIGMEELEEDRQRGIYDYEIDDDGKGVVLTMKSSGMGILYMSVGEPVNETGMLVIEVTDIKN